MNRKPHIAMILPDRIEHPVGGMGVQAKYLIKHLEKVFQFSVHGFPDKTSLSYYYGAPNLLSGIQHGGINTLTNQAAYLASIMKLVEKGERPDLIHVTDYTEYLGGYYAAKILNVPLIVSMQLSAHLMYKMGLYSARDPQSPDGIAIENSMKEMELLGLQKADHIIQVSNEYKRIFSQIPGLDEKSTYIPNGVELDEWEDFENVTLPGNGRLKVIYLGRFAPQKNIGALLEVTIPGDIDLIFIGDRASGHPELLRLIDEKVARSNNVHFLGPLFGKEKVSALRAADAVIIPSKHECHPIVMHEAMASSCILLHSGAGDMKEILTEDFAINCGSSRESIEIALQILRTLTDSEIEDRKRHGIQLVKNYTWQKSAEATKAVYNAALKKSVK